MSSQPVQFLFVVSLALSLSASVVHAQEGYNSDALKAAAATLMEGAAIKKCNPFIEAGCHVPIPDSGGPAGCTDCAPFDWADALRNNGKFIMPDDIVVEGTRIKLLVENKGGGMIFSLPGQTGQ